MNHHLLIGQNSCQSFLFILLHLSVKNGEREHHTIVIQPFGFLLIKVKERNWTPKCRRQVIEQQTQCFKSAYASYSHFTNILLCKRCSSPTLKKCKNLLVVSGIIRLLKLQNLLSSLQSCPSPMLFTQRTAFTGVWETERCCMNLCW